MTHIGDHSQVIFANEKPMKELMLIRKARRNIVDGSSLHHMNNVNSKIVTTSYAASVKNREKPNITKFHFDLSPYTLISEFIPNL